MQHAIRSPDDVSGGLARTAREDGVLDQLDVLRLATNLGWQPRIDLEEKRPLLLSRCRVLARAGTLLNFPLWLRHESPIRQQHLRSAARPNAVVLSGCTVVCLSMVE